MGTSTHAMVYSNEVVGDHMDEMIDWLIGNGIDVQNTRENVWTMKYE